jgi:chitinase
MRGTTRIIAVIALLIASSVPFSTATMRKVMYVDYQPVNWNDPSVTTNAIVDMGYNVVNLAFWLYGNPADFVGVWANAPTSQKQAAIDHAHSKGAIIMVACGGGTESPFEHDAADYGTKIGQFAANNLLDGIDFDLENFAAGLIAPGKTAQATIDWVVACNNAARSAYAAIRGKQPIISHAPQGPYFGKIGDSSSWAGALGGYTAIEKATQVDFYNVQFYNQGATCYTTYEGLFVNSGKSCSTFPGTSISEINQWGVPMNKIVLGKPLIEGDASNGFVSASALKTMITYAQSHGINWNAGVMFWMFHGNDQASASSMIQTLALSD